MTPDGAGKLKAMAMQGPGDAAFFDAATWRYEGGRVSLRDFRTDGGTTKCYRTSFDTDDLGYLTSPLCPRNPPTLFGHELRDDAVRQAGRRRGRWPKSAG